MLKSFSFGKNQASVLITLLILISLGACYFFIYLPNNEKAVQERRFRCLRKIDTNIHTKIENSFTQIANLLENYDKNSPPYINISRDSIKKKDSLLSGLREYISGYPKTYFTLLLPEKANKYFIRHRRTNNINRIRNDTPIFIREDISSNIRFYIDVNAQLTILAKKARISTTSNIGNQ